MLLKLEVSSNCWHQHCWQITMDWNSPFNLWLLLAASLGHPGSSTHAQRLAAEPEQLWFWGLSRTPPCFYISADLKATLGCRNGHLSHTSWFSSEDIFPFQTCRFKSGRISGALTSQPEKLLLLLFLHRTESETSTSPSIRRYLWANRRVVDFMHGGAAQAIKLSVWLNEQ